MNFFNISACVYGGILLFCLLMYTYKIHFWKYAKRKQKPFDKAEQNKKYAILVPARDESLVISGLLDSIEKNSYNQDNLHTFVMVSDENDPTIEICKKYKNVTCWCISRPTKCKGDVLDQLIGKIYSEGNRFDGYFIFDADNVLKPDFIELMHNCLSSGYDLVLGARLNKTPSANWVNCGSTLTWTYLNTLTNKCRCANGQNINIQGSPILVGKSIIEDYFGGNWPLTSLTEDVELTYICDLNNFRTYYLEDAYAYDEQPHTYSQSVCQRLRWIKGHNSVNVQYKPTLSKTKCKYLSGIYKYDKICALWPPILALASTLLFSLYSGISTIVLATWGDPLWLYTLAGFLATFVGSYFLLCIWTLLALWADKDKLELNFWQRLKAFFVVPFFYASYLPLYIRSLFVKNVTWKKVEHDQSIGENKDVHLLDKLIKDK